MTTNDLAGPDPATIVEYIRETYPETDDPRVRRDVVLLVRPEKHFPNYATIVTNNDYDDGSDLDREGVFRLNLGLTRATFERLVGDALDPARRRPTTRPWTRSSPTPPTRPSCGCRSSTRRRRRTVTS